MIVIATISPKSYGWFPSFQDFRYFNLPNIYGKYWKTLEMIETTNQLYYSWGPQVSCEPQPTQPVASAKHQSGESQRPPVVMRITHNGYDEHGWELENYHQLNK